MAPLLHTHTPSNSLPISLCPKTNRNMITALSSTNICQVLLLVLVLFQATTSNAGSSNPRCVASSCGDIGNISHPFRLKSDLKECGDPKSELICEDNRTVLYFHGGRFFVRSIDYSAQQFKLVDDGLQKDNCSSLPHHSEVLYNFRYDVVGSSTSVIVNCSKSVSSPFYISTNSCVDGSYSSNTSSSWNLYALLNPEASDVRNFCTISRWTWVSPNFGPFETINISSYNYELIHNIMADGFTLYFGGFTPYFGSTSSKGTFFCYFDIYSIWTGQASCEFQGYRFGKLRLAIKFYDNFA
ncbi:uncharacterized protein LOC130135335 [Syzygium oleosum]|uniref:uncharacterized protein LOC130135335 n=1 Tax=Syzygium oleosum TaxID=219896 RepID=UPI0024B88721|nr:uncharacterized protein LOC130135335 [Syzygium oleosum]